METLTYQNAVNPPRRGQGGYASDSLRAELAEHEETASGRAVVNLAYTDYGGGFFDKVAIRYLIEKHPENIVWEHTGWSGRNAFVFGTVAEEFDRETEDYPLGFEDIEEFFCQAESAEYDTAFESFVNDELRGYAFDRNAVLEWLNENRRGNCGITTQGVDYCGSDWIEELQREGIVSKSEED